MKTHYSISLSSYFGSTLREVTWLKKQTPNCEMHVSVKLTSAVK